MAQTIRRQHKPLHRTFGVSGTQRRPSSSHLQARHCPAEHRHLPLDMRCMILLATTLLSISVVLTGTVMDIRSPLGLAPAALPASLQAAAAGRPPTSAAAGDVALRRSSIVSLCSPRCSS